MRSSGYEKTTYEDLGSSYKGLAYHSARGDG
jgi:hypothetical protein